MSARNRELRGLVLAALVASTRARELSDRAGRRDPRVRCPWGALLGPVPRRARGRAPDRRRTRTARSFRSPPSADRVRPRDDLPPRPGRRRSAARLGRRRRRRPLRDARRAPPRLPRARVVPLPLRRRRDRAAAPAVRPRARRAASTARACGSTSARSSSSPASSRRSASILFLAGYLREKRESLAQGRLKDIGPLLAIWGAAMLVIVETNDLGSALLNFGIFLAMLYVATGPALFVAVGLALFVGGAAVALQRDRPRPATRHHLAAPVDGRARLLLAERRARAPPGLRLVPARRRASTRSRTAASAAPASGEGTFDVDGRHAAHPVPAHRLHLLGDRAGARPRRRGRAAPRLHALRRARHARSRCRAGRLLEAARGRA